MGTHPCASLRSYRLLLTLTVISTPPSLFSAQGAPASDQPKTSDPQTLSPEELAKKAMKSIVVVQFAGRDGRNRGLGTGFIIDANGLIATNMHVIGEARPITVTTSDGKKHKVTAIHATERAMDLAILKIDAKGLAALPLADSDKIRQGQPIVALGNPLGLKLSVVRGIVSGSRDIEGKPMIQLAVPIEEGNSGGPALDAQGRVIGILTMKHRFTDNLGFAVAINALKPLIKKPNPIPIDRWLTIGTLDKTDWRIHHGARWRQRAGRIHVEDPGSGFGGRALCFSQQQTPEGTYEVQARVKLHDDDGAAGLIFCADGADQHYGFYPTSGQMRLTRFDGPTVTSWAILKTLPIPTYRPGDWNTLKVRVTPDTISCYLNDKLVIETNDTRYRTRTVGLAKFRHNPRRIPIVPGRQDIAGDRPDSKSHRDHYRPRQEPSGGGQFLLGPGQQVGPPGQLRTTSPQGPRPLARKTGHASSRIGRRSPPQQSPARNPKGTQPPRREDRPLARRTSDRVAGQ